MLFTARISEGVMTTKKRDHAAEKRRRGDRGLAMIETQKVIAEVPDEKLRARIVGALVKERALLGAKDGWSEYDSALTNVEGYRGTLTAREPDPNDPVFDHVTKQERRVAEAAYEDRFKTKPIAHEHPPETPEFFKGRPVRHIDNPAELVKGIRGADEELAREAKLANGPQYAGTTVDEHKAQLAAKGLKEVVVWDEGQIAEIVVPVDPLLDTKTVSLGEAIREVMRPPTAEFEARKKPAYEPLGIIQSAEEKGSGDE